MKLPLTLDEQIEHIKTNKNIIFEEVSEDEAKKFLQIYGYGNIISAYKHHFHNGKNSEGNHIYTKHVDFKRYLEKYDSERDKHKIILTKVLKIENTLNTLVIDTILLDSKGFLSSNPNSKKLDAFLNHWFINILLESSREMKIKGNSLMLE